MKKIKPDTVSPDKSIIRWFFHCFLCYSLLFLIFLVPLISYCHKAFSELELQKSSQQMSFGISQLDNTTNGILNTAHTISSDIRFLPFFYQEVNYSEISFSIRRQMSSQLANLTFSLPLISDCIILFDKNVVIMPTSTMFNEQITEFYPDLFCVENFTFAEYHTMLQKHTHSFLPVYTIRNGNTAYQALTYVVPFSKNGYLFTCLDIQDIRQTLISKSDLDIYRMSISKSDGTILFADPLDEQESYHSVTLQTDSGDLSITVFIPHTELTNRMRIVYILFAVYLLLFFVFIGFFIFISSRLTSKPLLEILHIMEHAPSAFSQTKPVRNSQISPWYGFHYMKHTVQSYTDHLTEYQAIIDTQTRVLQTRFLEKALHGSLSTEQDYQQFSSYFPGFPERFCLLQLGITPTQEEELPYENPLSLIQMYLQKMLPDTYIQQQNHSELLLILDADYADIQFKILNHLIDNINLEEASYRAWGFASNYFQNFRQLPSAYWQIQDLYSRIAPDSHSRICMFSDHHFLTRNTFQMNDAQVLYTAITHGNREMALLKLSDYKICLSQHDLPTFEMIRSILLCIKKEQAFALNNLEIPSSHSGQDLYEALEEAISICCDTFLSIRQELAVTSFAQKVREYIDQNFTDPNLCMAMLAEAFQCSSSKIQKSFSSDFGLSVSSYIEKLRMEAANRLLLQNEDSITNIARKCGFTNDNTFYKAYKRVFGKAPTAARNNE